MCRRLPRLLLAPAWRVGGEASAGQRAADSRHHAFSTPNQQKPQLTVARKYQESNELREARRSSDTQRPLESMM